ncbi:hypothetical protein Tco_0109103, partial [Tanacetum coccineum]
AFALASTYAAPPENSLLAQTGDMAIFMDWFCKKKGITELKQQDLEGLAYEIVKIFHPNMINLYRKSGRPSLSISKMKAAYYPDVGLEQMVPDQMWIEEECKYDITAIAVRTHMRILSVVRIEVFSLYGYDYMKKIVLRRADLKEYTIAERDFKYLYPSDFEDLVLIESSSQSVWLSKCAKPFPNIDAHIEGKRSALSTLRRSGLRTTSTAAKPCQGDSLEFYLITGRIPDGSSCWQDMSIHNPMLTLNIPNQRHHDN